MKLDKLKLDVDYFEFDKKFYHQLKPTPLEDAHLISYSKDACDLIGLDYDECKSEEFVKFVNGERILEGSYPYSMAYSGHQFGYYVPKLGDGRAINLGSVNNWQLQTKGSGLTPYSRQGDGRAVLRSSIREYIMSEAMHALGIPTTRALALIGSSSRVLRSYDEVETGAVVMRMSPSWIRIGTFEFFSKTENSRKNLIQLSDYVIRQSYPHLENVDNKYEKMFYELVDNTAELIAKWQVYGFMHGVMNTDNMSMAGLTIDYGPYAFMDTFEKHNICNHTDEQGRYSYNNQPHIAGWNLEVLANTLKDICDFEKLMNYLKTFIPQHIKVYLELMNKRLGLDENLSGDSNLELIIELLNALENSKCDYNCFFYSLTKLENLEDFSSITDICILREPMFNWLENYKKVIESQNQDFDKMKKLMKKTNPKYIIKNYMLQEAIDEAKKGNFELVNDLLNIAQNPFDEHNKFDKYSKPTPSEYSNLMLSCSS